MAIIKRTKEGVPYISSETLASWCGGQEHWKFVETALPRLADLGDGAWTEMHQKNGRPYKVINMTRGAAELALRRKHKRGGKVLLAINRMIRAFDGEAARFQKKAGGCSQSNAESNQEQPTADLFHEKSAEPYPCGGLVLFRWVTESYRRDRAPRPALRDEESGRGRDGPRA
jgi:hypothetical protein